MGHPQTNVKKLNYFLNLLTPLTQSKEFKFLWSGQLFSLLGSSITMVILPIIVYHLTKSTVAMGIIMTCYMLPNILILPFSGLIVDRFNRIKIMMIADFVRFILLLAVTLLSLTHNLTIHYMYVIITLYGLMDGLFQPAYSAVRAKVFTPEIRTAANALNQASTQGIRLIGPTIGGLLITVFTASIGFGLDSVTFLVSIGTLFLLRNISFKTVNRAQHEGDRLSIKADFMEGIMILKKDSWLWATIIAFSILNICASGMIGILIPWLTNVHYHFPPYVYGMMMSASGAGALVSALIYGSRQTWKHRGLLAYGGVFLQGIVLLLISLLSSPVFLIVLMFFEGFGMMFFGLIWETSLQELVPEEMFGRVASLDMLGSFALLPLGYLLTGWVSELIGGIDTMMALSIIIFITVALVMLIPGVRQFD